MIVEEGAIVEKSTIRGPAIIGKNAKIIDSFVGPFTCVGDRTKLSRSAMENTICMEDCVISDLDVRLEDSLLGRNVCISRKNLRPRAFRVMVGDNSQIDLVK